jgi:hypothetical protein
VDLSEIKVKDANGDYTQDNQQEIKLKQLAYIRKVQFKMQHTPDEVARFIASYTTVGDIQAHIGELITPYKEGSHFADLPVETIQDVFTQFTELSAKTDGKSKRELRTLCELDAADSLKTGVVANMVGVVAHLLEKYGYNCVVSLENLCRAFRWATDGLTGELLPSTLVDPNMDFKDQENAVLAGLGTYHFFEMQLLKKLFRIQKPDGSVRHWIPAFRSVDNYEKIVREDRENVVYPFGMVHFVDPRNTSKKCPNCGKTSTTRKMDGEQADVLVCSARRCHFKSNNNGTIHADKGDKNIHFIQNGDDNGAYHIALKALNNL